MNKNKAFTLIELLVVIGIIGLLATILIVRLRQAQLQAQDSAIKQAFNTLRTKVEIDRDANGNFSSTCNGSGLLSTAKDYANINKTIKNNNSGIDVVCNLSVDSKSFAAWSPLREQANTYWCIDSLFFMGELYGATPPVGSTKCQ